MHHQFIWPSVAAVRVTPPHAVVMVMALKILQPSPTEKILGQLYHMPKNKQTKPK